MATPGDHLPQHISKDAINNLLISRGLPRANKIISPNVTAQYHSIYMIHLPPNVSNHLSLVLRVSGHHLPVIKTENEVGVMSWVAKNTTIPVPDIVAYDSSVNNPIAHEYTLLSRIDGVTLSDVYETLDDDKMGQILDQLIDFLVQLHVQEWDQIGGLNINEKGEIVVGQVLDETFWQVPDIKELWPEGESMATLNIKGPYPSYVALITAQIKKYIRLIQVHEKLETMRDLIPRLEAFVSALPQHSDELNNVKLRLAHKDLHFGNILYDSESGKITAVLDWEFSGVVPFPRWNPVKAFLWNAQSGDESRNVKYRLFERFEKRCKERGVTILKDAEYSSPLQESMHNVANYVWAIVEFVPRGQRTELVAGWRDLVLANLASFGV